MLKKSVIYLIDGYQMIISPSLKMLLGVNSVCRFDETCSAYTKRVIMERGAIKGTGLGAKRLLSCQPITN